MELTDKIISDLQDYSKLQDALLIIMQAIETKEVPTILPLFNDEWNTENVENILEKVAELK